MGRLHRLAPSATVPVSLHPGGRATSVPEQVENSRSSAAASTARQLMFSRQVANQVKPYRPVSLRLDTHDHDLRYLELIMCQLSRSNVSTPSARCRPIGR